MFNHNIKFQEENHTYTDKNGKPLISTTTLIKMYTPKFDETGSILKKCAEREGIEPEELRKEWDKKRDDAALRGTKFHKEVENYINTGKIKKGETKDLVEEFAKLKFNGKLKSETIIGSSEMGIAGTIDIIESFKNNIISLWDLKTNKKKPGNSTYYGSKMLYPIEHLPNSKITLYSLQMSVYSLMLEEEYGCFIKDLNLLYVDFEKRRIVPIPVSYLRDDALKIINHYIEMNKW